MVLAVEPSIWRRPRFILTCSLALLATVVLVFLAYNANNVTVSTIPGGFGATAATGFTAAAGLAAATGFAAGFAAALAGALAAGFFAAGVVAILFFSLTCGSWMFYLADDSASAPPTISAICWVISD